MKTIDIWRAIAGKPLTVGMVATAAIAGLIGCAMAATPAASDDKSTGGFAVVELFTSEGCSSCPPADALLGQLSADAQSNGQRLYAIEFHVDYWDRLGWRDPFSSAAATEYQQRYDAALNSDTYTPQMVVNGRVGFVGSDRAAAAKSIDAAMTQSGDASIKLSAVNDDGKLAVKYDVANAPAGTTLKVVVVQPRAAIKVVRGENGGRTLVHTNVARASVDAPLTSPAGTVTIALPGDLKPADAEVIGYLQDAKTLHIVAASKSAVGS